MAAGAISRVFVVVDPRRPALRHALSDCLRPDTDRYAGYVLRARL